MSEPTFGRDTSWFADLLLQQPSDYRTSEQSIRPTSNRHRLYSGLAGFLALGLVGGALGAAGAFYLSNLPVITATDNELRERAVAVAQRVQNLELENNRQREANSQLQDFTLPDLDGTLAKQIASAKADGGYAPLVGKGLTVTVTNPEALHESKVMDSDLQVLTNGLFAAGATGVSINGVRLTSSSAIREAAGVILIDFRAVSSPYVISAVGDNLRFELEESVAWVWLEDLRTNYSIDVQIEVRKKISLPAGRIAPLDHAERVNQ